MPRVGSGELARAEARLGVRFPADYRAFIEAENGREGWFGAVYLSLYSLDQVVELTEIHDHQDTQPGLVFIGSDGGGEAVGFDFRQSPPTVVLVNLVSSGWDEVILQASSFSEFMAQRGRGEEFRWGPER